MIVDGDREGKLCIVLSYHIFVKHGFYLSGAGESLKCKTGVLLICHRKMSTYKLGADFNTAVAYIRFAIAARYKHIYALFIPAAKGAPSEAPFRSVSHCFIPFRFLSS